MTSALSSSMVDTWPFVTPFDNITCVVSLIDYLNPQLNSPKGLSFDLHIDRRKLTDTISYPLRSVRFFSSLVSLIFPGFCNTQVFISMKVDVRESRFLKMSYFIGVQFLVLSRDCHFSWVPIIVLSFWGKRKSGVSRLLDRGSGWIDLFPQRFWNSPTGCRWTVGRISSLLG